MKTKLTRSVVIALLLLTFGWTHAQSDITILQDGKNGLAPRFLTVTSENQISINSYNDFLYKTLKVHKSFQFVEVHRETDELGITHLKVQQYLNDYPVENAFFIFHSKEGKIFSANGEVFKDNPSEKKSISSRSSISAQQALQNAKRFMGGNAFKWGQDGQKTQATANETLVYVCDNNDLNIASLKLAYKFDLYSKEPFDRKKVYIDASNGATVLSEDLKHSAFVEGYSSCSSEAHHHHDHDKGHHETSEEDIAFAAGSTRTGFYGTKNITVSGSSGRYLASQTGNRNISITNLNGANIGFSNSPPRGGSIISSSTTSGFGRSGNESYYMAAYWGAEKTWDMLREDFGRNGHDARGGKVNIFVNGSGQNLNNNAFWIGSWTYFGNATSGAPFTPLDVVSHEIAHGVTQTTANLVYRNESGAMNEGFSDILGCYAEYYTFNRLDSNVWTLGENISFQRSLSNPKQHRQPDTYGGTNWYTGSGDNGGVHINSGVLNHWFYILSQGKQGTNDKGSSYNVKGIGIEKAAQVAYRALTRYLTASSNFSSARNAVINAATDLYGANSCELVATTDAMYAVGVGAKYSGAGCNTNNCDAVQNVVASNITETGASISWSGKSGVSSYRLEYKNASTSTYTQVSVNGTSRSLSGLNANTTYQARVTYTCDGQLAPYSTVITFRTKDGVEPPACDAVTGVSASSITKNSAVISWSAKPDISAYVLEYKTSSSGSYTAVNVTGTSRSLSNLAPGTTYNVRIKYTCDDDGGGGDTGCDGLDAYQTYPKIYYSGDRVTYNGRKYECNANGVYNIPPTGSVYSYLWNDLGACSNAANTTLADAPYSAVISFTTLPDDVPSCNAVSSVNSTNVGRNSADISWSSVAGVDAYKLEYKRASSSTYTVVNLLGTNYALTGLDEETTYQVRVGYTCANGNAAPYSSVVSFTTEGGNSGGCNGIPEYQAGTFYQKGDKVVFNGNIWEAQITVWWSPIFGYWTNLGPCANVSGQTGFVIAPNPVNSGEVQIVFAGEIDQQNNVTISDYSGNVFVNKTIESNAIPSFSKSITIHIPDLKPGIYVIRVNGKSKKLIVE